MPVRPAFGRPLRAAARLCVIPAALAALLALSACDQSEPYVDAAGEEMESVTVTGSRMARQDFAANAPVAAPAPAPPPPPPPPPSLSGADAAQQQAGDPVQTEGMLLAYSYRVGFELPIRGVETLKDAHEAECRAAGPRLCLVLGGSVDGDGENYMYGNLSIRAEPAWLEQFRAGLEDDAEGADGRITSSSTSTEDLTRSIVDTDARLAAQETLRDRLILLLERPTDEVDDLLAVERELARVQGQIDSARSTLAVMRARVDMSSLDLTYSGRTPAVSPGSFNPVVGALRGFMSTLSESLAALITLFAALLPFLVILIPLVWLAWRWLRRRKRKSAA